MPSDCMMREFERELLGAFRGELRKVNMMVRPEERNSGMACRMACVAILNEFRPISVRGETLLEDYLRTRPSNTLYSSVEPGSDCRVAPIEKTSVVAVIGRRPRKKKGDHERSIAPPANDAEKECTDAQKIDGQ